MSVRQRGLAAGGPVVPAALAGAVLGGLGAFGASTFMPVGIARRAEIHRGFDADWAVLCARRPRCAVLVAAIALGVSWRQRRAERPRTSPRRSSCGTHCRPQGSPRSARSHPIGARMAFEPGRGRTAVPVRPALLGSLVGIGGGARRARAQCITRPPRHDAGAVRMRVGTSLSCGSRSRCAYGTIPTSPPWARVGSRCRSSSTVAQPLRSGWKAGSARFPRPCSRVGRPDRPARSCSGTDTLRGFTAKSATR